MSWDSSKKATLKFKKLKVLVSIPKILLFKSLFWDHVMAKCLNAISLGQIKNLICRNCGDSDFGYCLDSDATLILVYKDLSAEAQGCKNHRYVRSV